MLRIKFALAAAFLACAGLTTHSAFAQHVDDGNLIRSAATWADRFEKSLNQSLDGSSYAGSRLENRLEDWAKYIRGELKDAAGQYGEEGPFVIGPRTHVENALTAGEGINRAILAEQFPNIVESDWVRLRNGLNRLALNFALAPISTTRVSYARAGRGRTIARPQNQVLLDDLHESTKRFKDRFDDAVGKYTAPTERSRFAKQTANALEDSTGRLRDDFRDGDARSFRQNLQDTFVVAAAMNRIILGNQLSSTLKAQWSDIRNNLNRVGRAYGQPLLPDRISPPYYQPSQPLLTD